ncbi:hypothetical protein KR018_004790 [Drosophila ironensis]|nr:hypothetical protein KR018_004790 [Drosophila ironensis]
MPVGSYVLLWLLCLVGGGAEGGSRRPEVLLVIACPPQPRQAQAECFTLLDSVREQNRQMEQAGSVPGEYVLKVHVMHELFNYWTVLDALPHLGGQTRLLSARTEWIIWCQYNTQVASLRGLLEELRHQNPAELAFYGHALYDTEATIVHHFAHYTDPQWFPYPMLRAGVIFTGVLLQRLVELVAPNTRHNNSQRASEFSIDASHELARFIFDNLSREPQPGAALSGKVILKSATYICPSAGSGKSREVATGATNPCAMHAAPEEPSGWMPSTLGPRKERCPTTGSHIYFAIKTCAKFHKERIPIVERTWAADARHRRYYSDVADVSIPTISTGIANVQTGHCAKTMAILQLSLKDIGEQTDIRWLMLVDDDTLAHSIKIFVLMIHPFHPAHSILSCGYSVPRLSELLGRHDHTELKYLGQRYGYRLHSPDGFNYHTGGAGILLSLPLVRLVLEHCSCPSPSAPDDMILGYCMQALGVAAVPVAGMHQARPQDYARELLQLQPALSFHKFWNTEPERVYRQWLCASSGGNRSVPGQLGAYKKPIGVGPGEPARLYLTDGESGVYPGLESSGKHLDL